MTSQRLSIKVLLHLLPYGRNLKGDLGGTEFGGLRNLGGVRGVGSCANLFESPSIYASSLLQSDLRDNVNFSSITSILCQSLDNCSVWRDWLKTNVKTWPISREISFSSMLWARYMGQWTSFYRCLLITQRLYQVKHEWRTLINCCRLDDNGEKVDSFLWSISQQHRVRETASLRQTKRSQNSLVASADANRADWHNVWVSVQEADKEGRQRKNWRHQRDAAATS